MANYACGFLSHRKVFASFLGLCIWKFPSRATATANANERLFIKIETIKLELNLRKTLKEADNTKGPKSGSTFSSR